jgi:Domain of unknown function (DUF4145)
MPGDYVSPNAETDGFHCPHCQTYAHQTWAGAMILVGGSYRPLNPNVNTSLCNRCGRVGLWIENQLVWPQILAAPPPHDDLPEPALGTYIEARSVAPNSPRAAAALLRLSLQQLVSHLGATSDNLNTAVGELVGYGLPGRVQQAMDSVRLIGNEAVHPGTIDINDNPEIALVLFDLVNLVAELMVTQPKKVEALYSQLPEEKLDAIERRDEAGGNPAP